MTETANELMATSNSSSNKLTLNTAAILTKFDDLVTQGELFYEYTKPEVLENEGIRIALRSVPSFAHKPLNPSQGPASSKTHVKHDDGSDIDHADPAYFVAFVHGNPLSPDPTHKLIFNKFCVVRPQYLLLTVDPTRKQTENLDEADWSAALQVLNALGKEPAASRITVKDGEGQWKEQDVEVKPEEREKENAVLGEKRQYFALYNCSPTAGSSRMHKHIQIFPLPHKEDDGMELFDNLEGGFDEDTGKVRGLPFMFLEERLDKPWSPSAEELPHALFQKGRVAVAECSQYLELDPSSNKAVPHNHVLAADRMLTIPRRNATAEGLGGHVINAAGMLGHVWAGNEEQEKAWREVVSEEGRGLDEVFGTLGVRRDRG